MIITCPNCQTRYEVAAKAIGSAGRKVMCAHCHQAWQAMPQSEAEKPKPKLVKTPPPAPEPDEAEADRLFDEKAEAELDDAFEKEELPPEPPKKEWKPLGDKLLKKKPQSKRFEAANAAFDSVRSSLEGVRSSVGGSMKSSLGGVKTSVDSALSRVREIEMIKRQIEFAKTLPMGQIRANARLAGLTLLTLTFGLGIYFRAEIVRTVPDLAAVYSSVGLGVNVLGLDFKDVETVRSLGEGIDSMTITARIQNISGRPARVPPVIVTLLDSGGGALYSWSVTPLARSAGPGEGLDFETQLNSPPPGAEKVRLVFAEDQGG